MIFLSKQTPLGTGRHRKCYTHPDNARRCIKVIYNRNPAVIKRFGVN